MSKPSRNQFGLSNRTQKMCRLLDRTISPVGHDNGPCITYRLHETFSWTVVHGTLHVHHMLKCACTMHVVYGVWATCSHVHGLCWPAAMRACLRVGLVCCGLGSRHSPTTSAYIHLRLQLGEFLFCLEPLVLPWRNWQSFLMLHCYSFYEKSIRRSLQQIVYHLVISKSRSRTTFMD